ncbi:hypothetical protein HY792_06615 [Candidatus Desantisbacteria bacterium]|nr:hypothetical protein [Candidatus Desantisbacteria bacterium]
MICPNCGYEKNAVDAICCNLCHVVFRKKEMPLQETQEKDKGKTTTKEITTIDDLPDELKTMLLKEKDEVIRSSQNNFIDSKKMLLIGILLGFILLMIGGIFVLLPTMRTILMKE